MNYIKVILILLLAFSSGYSKAQYLSDDQTDDQIRKMIIRESIASYPGNCPCPDNLASNGSRCGKRSAYSRAGGYSPICYPEDVTREMIRRYRQKY